MYFLTSHSSYIHFRQTNGLTHGLIMMNLLHVAAVDPYQMGNSVFVLTTEVFILRYTSDMPLIEHEGKLCSMLWTRCWS